MIKKLEWLITIITRKVYTGSNKMMINKSHHDDISSQIFLSNMIKRHEFLGHIPVLAPDIINYCAPIHQGHIIDTTFGGGGHSRLLLETYDDMNITAIDQDPDAVNRMKMLQSLFPQRLNFIQTNFANIHHHISKNKTINGFLFDLGVSSYQLDKAERGFSFMHNARLDMRMTKTGISAYDIINHYDQQKLTDIIKKFGEEPKAKIIAKLICEYRSHEPIITTKQLSDIISQHVYRHKNYQKTHPATKTFQALRIMVNNELENLYSGLETALDYLAIGGRLLIISFHSLEDRIVKNFMNHYGKAANNDNRHLPPSINDNKKLILKIITKKPITASDEEIKHNPRSRSAKLRIAEKINHIT